MIFCVDILFLWHADMVVNFRPAFLPKRINIGKVGWLASLQRKKVVISFADSARNEFKKLFVGHLVKNLKDATMKIN